MTPALEFDGVVKRYGRRRALDGLDLQVPGGSVFGLVGSNGAGKTTAMAVAVGLLRVDRGHVRLFGEGPFHPARHAGRVTLLPQDSRMPPHGRVAELLLYYARLQGLDGREARVSVEEVIEWTHLADRRQSPVRTLSHGMGRRLAIAQAFLGRPELVLLDEPLSGLDPREVVRVRDLIRQRRGRQTILISSHNLHEIEALCDEVAFVEAGKRVRQDSLEAMTGRGQTLRYRLRPGAVPMADLQALRPGATWTMSGDGAVLTVRFDGTEADIPEINAGALALLLRAGVGILDVRRGSDLEAVYLEATDAAVNPGPAGPAP